jgi:uncharacterized protein (UPF0332 family)
LLMKIGVKSEIHDCTINIARLLANNGILHPNMAEDIAKAKQTRIDTQYYVENEQSPKTIQRDVEAARKFVLDTEKTIDTITAQQIDSIRAYLKKLKGQSP